MCSGMRVRSGVAAWTGLVAFVPICGLHCRSGRARSAAHQPKDDDSDVLPTSVVNRVTTLIQEGALRRACAALLQDPPVQPTEEVVASLRLLHPVTLLVTVWPRTRFGGSRLLRLLQQTWTKFARLSSRSRRLLGAGRFGLRPSHVRDAMRPASSDLHIRLLSEVVCLLLRGEVPEMVRPYVRGASIMALRKPNGSLRPIATSETIRRLTSKVAVDLITERARVILEPLQLGVKTPNGCEALIHAARQWFARNCLDPSKVAISVDVSNAFNTVHSSAVLRAVRVHFPSLSPWVDCCYRRESTLFTGSGSVALQVIPSTRGCNKGSLGPVLFALARAVTETSHLGGVDIGSFFLDDGFCGGSTPAVRCFLTALTEGFRRVGLTVNMDKTEIIPACPSAQSFGPG